MDGFQRRRLTARKATIGNATATLIPAKAVRDASSRVQG